MARQHQVRRQVSRRRLSSAVKMLSRMGRLRVTGGGVGMRIVFHCEEEERKVEEEQ